MKDECFECAVDVNLLDQEVYRVGPCVPPNYIGWLKKVEWCGRVSYKSHDKTKPDSYKRFFNILNSNKHTSVFEHMWFLLDLNPLYANIEVFRDSFVYTIEIYEVLMHDINIKKYAYPELPGIFSLNLRTLLEVYNKISADNCLMKAILYRAVGPEIFEEIDGCPQFMNEDYEDLLPSKCLIEHPEYYTFEIITNRAIANEIVRHRQMSYTQESTRYVNYSNNKSFNFIKNPAFDKVVKMAQGWNNETEGNLLDWYVEDCRLAAEQYLEYLAEGVNPQHARDVLPLGLATTIVVTGTKRMWEDFLSLRSKKDAHPQIREIAEMIEKDLN